MEEHKLIKLLKKGCEINISCDARRTEDDSTGKELPNGRDFYGLYNYKITDLEGTEYKNEWPGYYDLEDMLKEIEKIEVV